MQPLWKMLEGNNHVHEPAICPQAPTGERRHPREVLPEKRDRSFYPEPRCPRELEQPGGHPVKHSPAMKKGSQPARPHAPPRRLRGDDRGCTLWKTVPGQTQRLRGAGRVTEAVHVLTGWACGAFLCRRSGTRLLKIVPFTVSELCLRGKRTLKAQVTSGCGVLWRTWRKAPSLQSTVKHIAERGRGKGVGMGHAAQRHAHRSLGSSSPCLAQ